MILDMSADEDVVAGCQESRSDPIQKIPVSVAIVTANEECNIRDALESVRSFREVVVVDAMSTDRTAEICSEYTDKIFRSPWKGYAAQKQDAVDRTSLEWVLILDADERVSPQLREEIQETLAATPHAGFAVPRRNYFLGRWIRHSGWWPDHTLRLFRKSASRVEMREVHEKVVVSGSVGTLRSPLEHYSYRTISDFLRKSDAYSSLSAKELMISSDRRPFLPMLLNPLAVFLKMYLLRQGFRDGAHGFVLAVLYSYYTFLKYAKLWERKG